jgi:hypothetical protein
MQKRPASTSWTTSSAAKKPSRRNQPPGSYQNTKCKTLSGDLSLKCCGLWRGWPQSPEVAYRGLPKDPNPDSSSAPFFPITTPSRGPCLLRYSRLRRANSLTLNPPSLVIKLQVSNFKLQLQVSRSPTVAYSRQLTWTTSGSCIQLQRPSLPLSVFKLQDSGLTAQARPSLAIHRPSCIQWASG